MPSDRKLTSLLRLDRLLTLFLFHPLMHSKLMKSRSGIPILMYHSISDDLEPGIHPYYQTCTSPETFAEHMRYLHENGYTVLTLQEAIRRSSNVNSFGQKAVVLTFDDGLSNFYSAAFPILQRNGYPCTVFLPTAFLDDRNRKFRGKECLSWDEVRALHAQGVGFGSHTMTHPQLTALDLEDIKAEIELSKKRIEMELQENIESFSYPFAFPEENAEFVKALRQLLQSAGYKYGVSTKIGILNRNEDPFFLKRIPLNECDDIGLLKAKLEGAYDWVYPLQRFFKYSNRIIKQ